MFNFGSLFFFKVLIWVHSFFQVKEDGSMSVLGVETHSVGAKISTKQIGSNWRQDLTDDYKYPEGTYLFEILDSGN